MDHIFYAGLDESNTVFHYKSFSPAKGMKTLRGLKERGYGLDDTKL
jgi:hypothetical protein